MRELGVSDVYVAATHPVFSKDAYARLKKAGIKRVVVTDTIPSGADTIISVAKTLAMAIRTIYDAKPMGKLFEKMMSDLRLKK